MRKVGILVFIAIFIVIIIVLVEQKIQSKTVVSIKDIQGIDLPVPDKMPVKAILETTQYTGTVSWLPLPKDGVFDYSVEYTAIINLTPKKGFTLLGVPKNFFKLEGAKVANEAGSNEINVSFPKTSAAPLEVISLAVLDGITPPVAQEAITNEIKDTEQYTATLNWSPFPENNVFAYSTEYTAKIEITPKEGYTLKGVPKNFFKVAGANFANMVNSGLIEAKFPKTDDKPVVIDISNIKGIQVPIVTEKAATYITETPQYKGSVTWEPSLLGQSFNYDTEYIAKIKIIEKPGFTVKGLPENFFSVEGAKTINKKNSGLITAIFPATKKEVTQKDIFGVTVPSAKRMPEKIEIETMQYRGKVSWQPEVSPEGFDYNTVYTAKIELETKQGYTFAGLKENFFKLEGAKTKNNQGSGIVYAVFPTTKKEITINEISAVKEPVAGETMIESKINTDQYNGYFSWEPAPADKIFDYYTVYTAHLQLFPKQGYTFNGLRKNFFTIKGAKVENDTESGLVTAVFRKTLKIGYDIGDIGPAGGIIFYVDKDNNFDWKYLEVTPYEPTRKSRWGDSIAVKGDAANGKFGNGKAATRAILASGQTNTIATYAKTFEYGKYNDWFCPTMDELMIIYENLTKSGIADIFENKSFWSSSEDKFDTAYTVSFYNGSCSSGIYKKANKHLLLIRSF